jgi:hypothetical protein
VSQNLVLTVIGAAVGVGLVAVIAYQVARFMRGSITLSLRRGAFNPGDTITGRCELHTKKAIHGNQLSVSLIGVQVTTSYNGGKRRTRSREIYRNEVLLEEGKAYPAGHTAGYDFQLVVPNANAPEFLDSPLGQTLSTALRLLSNRDSQLKWKVEARLDAQGVDLAAAQSVSINTGQWL